MPALTPNTGLPYPLGTDPLRVAPDIRDLALAIDEFLSSVVWSPGDLKPTVASVAPDGWLLLNGSSIANGDTLYPGLWAVAPASWKSGTNLVLPNMSGRTVLGGGTTGAVGGANSRTLTIANLPSHDHAMAHTHSIAHDHSASTTSAGGHTHDIFRRRQVLGSEAAGESEVAAGLPTSGTVTNAATGTAGAHAHPVNIGASSPAASGGASPNRTADTGGGDALDTTPSNMRANWLVKT